MAGLFGYLAAGAAQGVGDNMVEQAKAKREAALEELRISREMEFRRGEREASQAFQSGENALSRDASAEQARLNRENSGDLLTLEDGSSGVRSGSTVKPLTDANGKPVRAVGDKSESPADVKAAEWLIKQGVAKDAEDAWNKVRSAREGITTSADVEKMVEAAVKTEFDGGFGSPKPEDIEASRTKNRARILKNLGLDGEDQPPGAKPDAAEKPVAEMKRPAGATDEEIVKQATDALAKGADKAAVASRLREMGIDPKAAGI